MLVEREEAERDGKEGVFVFEVAEEGVCLGGGPGHGAGRLGDAEGLAFDEFYVGVVFAKGFDFSWGDGGASVKLLL